MNMIMIAVIPKSRASSRKSGAGPRRAISKPPIAGIISRVTLNAMEFNAKAFTRFSFGTICANKAILAGSWMIHERPARKTNKNKFQALVYP